LGSAKLPIIIGPDLQRQTPARSLWVKGVAGKPRSEFVMN
jgi:hypothetical protein